MIEQANLLEGIKEFSKVLENKVFKYDCKIYLENLNIQDNDEIVNYLYNFVYNSSNDLNKTKEFNKILDVLFKGSVIDKKLYELFREFICVHICFKLSVDIINKSPLLSYEYSKESTQLYIKNFEHGLLNFVQDNVLKAQYEFNEYMNLFLYCFVNDTLL